MRSLENLYILYNTSTIKLAFEEYYVRRRELYQSLITGTFVRETVCFELLCFFIIVTTLDRLFLLIVTYVY